MAEIILPPEEENEETPQTPELNIDKPAENSKVITIEFEAKKTNKVSTKDTNQQLYTTDTDAWFEFKETSLEGANGTYSVVFRNRHDGSVFQRTGDVVNGVAYYKIPHQEIRHAGAWRGQLVYTLENGDTTAREFGYDVKGHILDGKDVREIVVEDFETLMSQLRSMKDNAELELASLVNTANQNETDRQVFFDGLVEDIDELQANYQELLDTGVLQTNINTKLEALEEEYAPRLTEVTAQLAQNAQLNNQGGSFVEKTKNLMNVKGMYARKISADSFGIGIGLNDFLNTVIEYKFDRNTDGLFLLRGVFTGEQSTPVYSYPLITLNGSFIVASSGGSTYTTTPEDSFIFEFTGTKLEFGYRAENRGGVWEFELSKPPINQVARLSTYATTPSYPTTTIFEDLPYDTYQVKATFKGDDPINPPATSPSRGYLNYNPDDLQQYWPVRSSNHLKVNLIDDSTKRELVSKDSIPDFAIRAKAKGASYANVWVPKHSTVGGVSTSVTHKIVLDGDIYVIDGVPTDGMEIKHFFLTHRFNAVNPNGGGTMWVHYLTHTITEKSPFVEITNRIEVSQDLEIQNMYFGMLPVNDAQVSRLVFNEGTEYNKPFPTSSQFVSADVSSFMYTGSYEAGRGHAAAIDNISYSEAVGLNERSDYSDPSNLSFTNAGINKAYFSVMRNGEVQTGDVFSNMHRIIVIGGLHFPNELLKQM